MNLCIDIGNTRSKYAVFDKDQLVAEGVWSKVSVTAIRKVEKEYPLIQRIIVSTVTLLDKKLKSEIQKNTKQYLLLDHKTAIPIQNKYETPKTLGKDRLSAVIGATAVFPKRNCLVIDAGTCIKYDFINAEGVYRGGSISPGVQMRLKAMHHFTAKLPLVKTSENDEFIGKNTREAILSGAQHGALAEIKGMIAAYVEKYGRIKVIITGGDAIFFANRMKRRIFVSPNLVLIGLNRILSFNQ
jgi:type III pantothenate kinase